ncbi:MAG: DUF362 domain-containing protein [Candidatus Eisenbacteria sp.]|nr:DUF362 domain-containing protein [Candidatus Eisenbacteria bacterium]
MDRRRFLKSSVRALGTGLLLPTARALGADPLPPGAVPVDTGAGLADLPDLVLAKDAPKAAVHRAIQALGGIGRFVQPGQVVVVKPNASFETPPDWGATTHPEVIAGVLEACFEAGARRVLIVDHTMKLAQRCFKRSGIADAVAGFPKAKLVSLDKEKVYRELQVPAGKALHVVQVPALMQKADVFINVPTAKAHSATRVSLGLKNLMGLVWDRHRFHHDMDLHQAIADLATVLKPQLTVIDAMRILKTGGPSGPGAVDPFGGVIAGVDPVAVDAFGVGLSTWNGQTCRADQINYIRYAAEHGLGTSKPEALRVLELN